jgi:hypothetical protein
MDSLPPVENPQFSMPVESPSSVSSSPGVQASGMQAPSRSKKPVFFAISGIFAVLLLALVAWFVTGRGQSPTSISLIDNEFASSSSSGVQSSPTTGFIPTSSTPREDSPGFVGGKAPEGASANADGCTLDTFICPDGSYVGRQGPDCSFAACTSTSTNVPSGWSQHRNEQWRFSIAYPSGWRGEEKTDDGNHYFEISPEGYSWDPNDENSTPPPRLRIEPSEYFSDMDSFSQVNKNGITMLQQTAESGNIFYVPIPQRTAEYLSITGGERNSGRAEDEVLREIFSTFRIF